MKLLNSLRKIKKNLSNYQPSVEVLVYKKNLVHNLNEFKIQYPKINFSPVLKSNAYGHGLVEVAKIFDQQKLPFFTVDSLFEANLLRNNDIKTNILVIGYTNVFNIQNFNLEKVAITITSLEQLIEIDKTLKKKKVFHIKIDTGMHRQGLLPDQVNDAINIIKKNKYIQLEGICSHFADADSPIDKFTNQQISTWSEVVEKFKNNFTKIKYYHLTNSAGTFYSKKAYCNVARLGISLYGVKVSPQQKLNLLPCLELQTIVSSIKTINNNEFIGYGLTYKTKAVTKIATIPVGYFEGIKRKLSNCGAVKISNNTCPIIGKVSMNITTIDVTEIKNLKLEDKVVVISHNENDPNSIVNIAKQIDAIPYEVLVTIPQHLRRTIVN